MQEETSEWYCALKNTAVLYYAITTVSWAFACQKNPPIIVQKNHLIVGLWMVIKTIKNSYRA